MNPEKAKGKDNGEPQRAAGNDPSTPDLTGETATPPDRDSEVDDAQMRMKRKAETLHSELAPQIAELISQDDLVAPFISSADVAFHHSFDNPDKSDENTLAFKSSSEVENLKKNHFKAYSNFIAAKAFFQNSRFASSEDDQFLNWGNFEQAYAAFTEGRFTDAIKPLQRTLDFIQMSVFSAPHNIHEQNADIVLIQHYATMLVDAIKQAQAVHHSILRAAKDRPGPCMVPEHLAPLSANITKDYLAS